jgi:hypothetical protein
MKQGSNGLYCALMGLNALQWALMCFNGLLCAFMACMRFYALLRLNRIFFCNHFFVFLIPCKKMNLTRVVISEKLRFSNTCLHPRIIIIINKPIFSFGLADDWSFEEVMADMGCTVRAFDPTVEKPKSVTDPRIHFKKLGLAHFNGNTQVSKYNSFNIL